MFLYIVPLSATALYRPIPLNASLNVNGASCNPQRIALYLHIRTKLGRILKGWVYADMLPMGLHITGKFGELWTRSKYKVKMPQCDCEL